MIEGRTFLLLGSGEFEPWSVGVERAALQGRDGPVLVLATASVPDGGGAFGRWSTMGLEHYASSAIPAVALQLKTREDAHRKDLVAALDTAAMVFFSGGKPRYLADTLGGTPFWTRMIERLDQGMVYAGCSAGAMVTSRSRHERRARRLGAGWMAGLGLIPNAMFGVHWDKVGRIPGLRPFIMSRVTDQAWFVGIDERTAILGDGRSWIVHGVGTVTVRSGERARALRAGETFVIA